MNSSSTIFLDIDGVLIEHPGSFEEIITFDSPILPGVKKVLSYLEGKGVYIVLTTARKECMRAETEKQLKSYGIFWDQLIMGLNNGSRYLINDRKPDGRQTAFSHSVERNGDLTRLLDWCTDFTK